MAARTTGIIPIGATRTPIGVAANPRPWRMASRARARGGDYASNQMREVKAGSARVERGTQSAALNILPLSRFRTLSHEAARKPTDPGARPWVLTLL